MEFWKQRVGILIAGTACGLLVWARMDVRQYWMLPLLPFCCGICYFLCPSMLRWLAGNPGICAFNAVIGLRYLVLPALLAVQGFLPLRGRVSGVRDTNLAVLLMIYELAACFAVVQLAGRRFYFQEGNGKVRGTNSFAVLGFAFAGIGMAAVFPGLRAKYSFILSAGGYLRGRLQLPGWAELAFQFGCLFFLLKLVEGLALRFPGWKGAVCAVGVVLFGCCFIPYSSRFSVVLPLLAGWCVLLRGFPNCRKMINRLFTLSLVFLLAVTTLKKDSSLQQLSSAPDAVRSLLQGAGQLLQSYFGGVSNVSISVTMKTAFAGAFTPMVLLGDLFKSVMGVSGFFTGSMGTTALFNHVFYGENLVRDQIVPMIGQGYAYFGLLFAPLFSAAAVLLLMQFDSLCRRSDDLLRVYLYGYLAARFGLFMMVNASILTAELTNFLLPISLLLWLNDRLSFWPKGGNT